MVGFAKGAGKWTRMGLATLGVAAMAVPVASALAVAQDPTQAAEGAAQAAQELTAEQVEQSRATFNNFSCGACHVLGDAGATGQIGPALDGNDAMDHEFIVSRITNGAGAMPGFGGQIPEEEIGQLATYILQVKE